jgi:hypothetical protein
MTNKFKTKFLKLLKEAPELEFDPTMERDAAESSMDGVDDVGIDDFDIDVEPDPNATDGIDDATKRENERMGSIVDKWTANINEFIRYINDDESESIQKILKNANPSSIFGKLQKQQNQIAKIAGDLATLRQAFIAGKNIK